MSPINYSPDLKARALREYNPEAPVKAPAQPVRKAFGKRKAGK
jgi:hypothetical protein